MTFLRGEKVIFSLDASLTALAWALRSLRSFEDHWVLEILFDEDEL